MASKKATSKKATSKKATSKKVVEAEVKKVIVTVDDKKFTVAPNFRFKGISYKAEEAVKDKELIAELVEANSFVLSEQK